MRSVLFVSNTRRIDRPYIDPSTRYRAFNIAGELARTGIRTAVVSQALFDERYAEFADYDLFVFHRPVLTERNVTFFERHRRGPNIVADFDDAIIDVAEAHLTSAHVARGEPLAKVARFVASVAEAADAFGTFTASTQPLVEQVTTLFAPQRVVLVSNALPADYLGIARTARRAARDRPFRFGYFPGTATHDADFASMVSALVTALRRDSRARLLLVGPLSFPRPLEEFRDRIAFHEVVPFNDMPLLLSLVETVLAPLQMNAFNAAKSGIKFIEAGVAGCRVVATPIPDITRFESALLTLCRTHGDWERALLDAPDLPVDVREREAGILERQVSTAASGRQWLAGIGA